MATNSPPSVLCSWTPPSPALGANFAGYRLRRRPARAAAAPAELVAEITVPTGYTPAVVEAQHVAFIDYEAGWSPASGATSGKWADGWDYWVTAVDASTGLEGSASIVDTRNIVLPDDDAAWLVSNAAPWLNTPLGVLMPWRTTEDDRTQVYPAAGRDFPIVAAPAELPGRVMIGTWETFDRVGQDQVRAVRAAAASGKTVCIQFPLGDRIIGRARLMDVAPRRGGNGVVATVQMWETTRSGDATTYNLPCGIALDGTADYVTHADDALIDPAGGAFTVVTAGRYSKAATNRYALAKGNIGVGQGYAIRNGNAAADVMQGVITGATTTVTLSHTSASWFDGEVRVATLTYDGTNASALYLDDEASTSATSTTATGAIANAIALTVGAHNAGAAGFGAHVMHAWAYYPRVLSAAERQATARWLRGIPGYRPAAGPALFVDLRDDRCWNGTGTTLVDLAGNNLTGTTVSSPPTRGIPWPLSTLEEF